MSLRTYKLGAGGMIGAVAPGAGTMPDCGYGDWWNPATGRCEPLFTPRASAPQEPLPEPVDPYADQPEDQPVNPYEPAPLVPTAPSSKKWLIVGAVALGALALWKLR